MIEILKKYYDIEIQEYKEYKNGMIFYVNGINYLLIECNYDQAYINELFKLCSELKRYRVALHDFVFNKNNEILSENYILFKINVLINDIDLEDIKLFGSVDCNKYIKEYVSMESFWEKKIDYFEAQISELSDNQLINHSFDYYIGIAELLIMYLKKNHTNIDLCLSHKTLYSLSTIDFYNPLNITFDLKLKDVASYIRMTNNIDLLTDILDRRGDNFNSAYFFVRLVFPFKYFDIISDMIIDREEENELANMLNHNENYEEYVAMIQKMFGIYIFSWIKKE